MDKLKEARERVTKLADDFAMLGLLYMPVIDTYKDPFQDPFIAFAADLRALLAQSEVSARLRAALEKARWYVADHQEARPNDESRDDLALIDAALTQAPDNDRKDGE